MVMSISYAQEAQKSSDSGTLQKGGTFDNPALFRYPDSKRHMRVLRLATYQTFIEKREGMMNKYSATCFIWAMVTIITLGAGWITHSTDVMLIFGFLAALTGCGLTDALLKNNDQKDQQDERRPEES